MIPYSAYHEQKEIIIKYLFSQGVRFSFFEDEIPDVTPLLSICFGFSF
mgnify:CR=1 FL=1